RLRRGARKDEERRERERGSVGVEAAVRRVVEDRRQLGERERLRQAVRREREEEQQDAARHPEVADAVGEERLLARVPRRRLAVVVADERVAADADELPEDERLDEVRAEHDAEHREREERQAREVAAVAVLALHVASRVEEDAAPDA